jgi:hypothetical protein
MAESGLADEPQFPNTIHDRNFKAYRSAWKSGHSLFTGDSFSVELLLISRFFLDFHEPARLSSLASHITVLTAIQ